MIYLFITERGAQERLLGTMPTAEMAVEAAQRLVARQPQAGEALVDRAVICQQVGDQLVIQQEFARPAAGTK